MVGGQSFLSNFITEKITYLHILRQVQPQREGGGITAHDPSGVSHLSRTQIRHCEASTSSQL